MILPKGRWHVSLDNFQGQVHQKIIYTPVDEWKRSGPFCLPNQNELMHETCTGTSMPIHSSFITLSSACQHRHFQNNQPPMLFSTWHTSDQSGSSRHDKIQLLSIKAEQSVIPTYKQEPKAHSMHSWLSEETASRWPLHLRPEQILIAFDLSQMLHPLYCLLSSLQY